LNVAHEVANFIYGPTHWLSDGVVWIRAFISRRARTDAKMLPYCELLAAANMHEVRGPCPGLVLRMCMLGVVIDSAGG